MNSAAYRYGITPPVAVGGNAAPWARALEWAGRLILRLVAAHSAARRARATMHELQRLNDRELEDIGLTRGDVDLMAVSVRGANLQQRDWSRYL
jgi:uncharacterized protein YjiS (DUF1127 family)